MLQKKVFYTLIMVIISITIFATAATCSMCGVDLVDNGEQEQAQDSKESSLDEKDDVSSTDKDTKSKDKTEGSKIEDNQQGNKGNGQEGSKDNGQKSGDGNGQESDSLRIMDLVIGDVMDQHVEPATNYLTDSIYTCHPVLAQKPDGTETYNWTVSGGNTDDGAYYMQWTTPPDEGWYTVTVDVQRGSASDTFSRDIYVEPNTAMGPPLEGPQITGISVVGQDGTKVNVNDTYFIEPIYTDPNNIIVAFYYEVDFGIVKGVSGGVLEWISPDFPTVVNITVITTDSDRNEIVRETFTLEVILAAEA